MLSTHVFTAQLSNASGSFANPTNIGTYTLMMPTAMASGIITCTLPAMANGTHYRVRVICDNPAMTSPDNGYDVTIRKEKTGPLPQNVKYTVMPSRSTVPLTGAEREIEMYNLDSIFKRQSYEEQKKWLLENTSLFTEETADDLRSNESMEDL
jgi:hypothetical protein